jgi:hypothetical protein
LRAYRADWARFAAWCAEKGFVPVPAAPATVGAYLGSLADSHAPTTIRRRLAALGKLHRFNDLPWNPAHRDIQGPLQDQLLFPTYSIPHAVGIGHPGAQHLEREAFEILSRRNVGRFNGPPAHRTRALFSVSRFQGGWKIWIRISSSTLTRLPSLGTGCGFLKAGEFGCKPPLSLDSRDRRKDAPRKIVRSAQTQLRRKSHYQCRLLAILTSRQSD